MKECIREGEGKIDCDGEMRGKREKDSVRWGNNVFLTTKFSAQLNHNKPKCDLKSYVHPKYVELFVLLLYFIIKNREKITNIVIV